MREHIAARVDGFTLIELSVVLVVVGILLSAGTLAWFSIFDSRRMAESYSALTQVRNCLEKRMFFDNRYPDYTANLDCDQAGRSNLNLYDVDACLCQVRDGYGQRIFFLEGVNATSEALAGTNILDNPAQNRTKNAPSSSLSAIVNKDGKTVPLVAFALISPGKNLTLDTASHPSYNLFGGDPPTQYRATINPPSVPDFTFQANDDDIMLYVTWPELASRLQ